MVCLTFSSVLAASWTTMNSGTNNALNGIWGSSNTNIVAVGDEGIILLFNGSFWTQMDSGTSQNIEDVWGTSSMEVFAVGHNGTIRHYDGKDWSAMTSNTTANLTSVWGSSAEDVFAVGEEGIILHYDGFSWSKLLSPTSLPLQGIWGPSGTDVYAVGYDGTLLRYDGVIGFSEMTSVTDKYLRAIWGGTDSEIFAVGYSGSAIYYDGSTWSEMILKGRKNLYGLSGSAGKYAIAVGEDGVVFLYNGSDWSELETGNMDFLKEIWVSQSHDVFAVGANGTILHYRNVPPTASFTMSQNTGHTETIFSFDASISFDVEDLSDELEVRWDWENDGTWDTVYTTNKEATHQYAAEGTYTVVLEVKDTEGFADRTTRQITISANSIPTAIFMVSPRAGNTLTNFRVDASGCFDVEDTADALEVRWDWENDGTWDTEYTIEKTATHRYGMKGAFSIRLQVLDAGGLTDSTTQQVTVGVPCVVSGILGENDPRTESLRRFRDEVLDNNPMGRKLIKYYYQYDETWTELLDSNPTLKHFVARVLDTLVPAIEKLLH
jgi:PKD repeat protein